MRRPPVRGRPPRRKTMTNRRPKSTTSAQTTWPQGLDPTTPEYSESVVREKEARAREEALRYRRRQMGELLDEDDIDGLVEAYHDWQEEWYLSGTGPECWYKFPKDTSR